MAYQEEARRRAEAELRAAKAERELGEERSRRTEAERRVPYDTAVSWLGSRGGQLMAAWVLLLAEQEAQVVAHAEALATGEPWPPRAVPEQPTTRREGSSPPVSTEVSGQPGINTGVPCDTQVHRLEGGPPSPFAASVPPQRQAALEKLVEACRQFRRTCDTASTEPRALAGVQAGLDIFAALAEIDNFHIAGPDDVTNRLATELQRSVDSEEEIAAVEEWIRNTRWPIQLLVKMETEQGGADTGPKFRRLASYHRKVADACEARAFEIDRERVQRCSAVVPAPGEFFAPGFDGASGAPPRRCVFDGHVEGGALTPEGGWAWSQVGGRDVCSERCRLRETARQAQRVPGSAKLETTSPPIPCVQCGADVEEPRRSFTRPTCYACLPLPESLKGRVS